MEETIFTKIIKGDIPCYKIDENEQFIAFLASGEMSRKAMNCSFSSIL